MDDLLRQYLAANRSKECSAAMNPSRRRAGWRPLFQMQRVYYEQNRTFRSVGCYPVRRLLFDDETEERP